MNKPEEVVMAALAILWIILTFFIGFSVIGLTMFTTLLVSFYTLIWAVVFFVLWQKHYVSFIWPIFLGLLVVCWWPAINQLARDQLSGNHALPWYAGWAAKCIYALIPIALGYLYKWTHRQPPVISKSHSS